MNRSYAIISPVRNEEDYIRRTIESVIQQTQLPVEWVIVNDGSTDQTEAIVREYMTRFEWIKLVTLKDRGYYFPGTGVVNVFNAGMAALHTQDWGFVVKLDVDLSFEPNYFAELLNRFERQPQLGMASGVTYLREGDDWEMEPVQPDHPVGPSKVYRRECYDQIGGLKAIPGWDLADLLGAQMKGWTTVCFQDLMIKHYRPTGTRRDGLWSRSVLQGRFEFRHGYAAWYTVFKALYHLARSGQLVFALGKICGFCLAWFKSDPYLFDEDMRRFLRQKHAENFKTKLGIRSKEIVR